MNHAMSHHTIQLHPVLRAVLAALPVTLAVTLIATLAGCAAPFNYTGQDSPRAMPALTPFDPPPRIALVLTSVGSLLGAFWADGRSAAELDALSENGGPPLPTRSAGPLRIAGPERQAAHATTPRGESP